MTQKVEDNITNFYETLQPSGFCLTTSRNEWMKPAICRRLMTFLSSPRRSRIMNCWPQYIHIWYAIENGGEICIEVVCVQEYNIIKTPI